MCGNCTSKSSRKQYCFSSLSDQVLSNSKDKSLGIYSQNWPLTFHTNRLPIFSPLQKIQKGFWWGSTECALEPCTWTSSLFLTVIFLMHKALPTFLTHAGKKFRVFNHLWKFSYLWCPNGFLAHPTFYFIRFNRLFPLSVISNEASVVKYVACKHMQNIGKNALVMLKVSPISSCLILLWFSLLNKE